MTLHHLSCLSPVLMAFAPAQSDADASVPEWIHLLPVSNGRVMTDDKRGPYHAADPEGIISQSFEGADRLPIDQDHATDLAAPKGLPAPARGWIVAMEARADGIWGKVEWTGEGRRLVADRAYRGISPVLMHDENKVVRAIPRASLVNRPNLKGLVALNSYQEKPMDKIAEALGLKAGAGEGEILDAIARMNKKPGGGTAMQASLQAAQDAVADLTTQVGELTAALQAREAADKRGRAEAFVDAAIAAKRAGINDKTREHYVSLHMSNPAQAEAIITGLPQLGPTGMTADPPATVKDGEIALNASDLEAARLLGVPVEKMLEARKKEAK